MSLRTASLIALAAGVALICFAFGLAKLQHDSLQVELRAQLVARADEHSASVSSYLAQVHSVARNAVALGPVTRLVDARGAARPLDADDALAALMRIHQEFAGQTGQIALLAPSGRTLVDTVDGRVIAGSGTRNPIRDAAVEQGPPAGESMLQTAPYRSPMTDRWVIGHVIPIGVSDGRAGALYLELGLQSLGWALGNDEIQIVDRQTGGVLVDTATPVASGRPLGVPRGRPFAPLVARSAPAGVVRLGDGRLAAYRHLASSGSNNRWTVVTPALRPVGAWAGVNTVPLGVGALGALLVLLGVVAGNLARRQLERIAGTDSLTGLPNRRTLERAVGRAAATATAERPFGLILLDLDGFKNYNDSFGHPAGDALLVRMGGRLAAATRPYGVAHRLGGDEFCVLVETGRLEDAVAAAEAALVEYGDGFGVTASSGSVRLPLDAATAESAMRIADERLYQRKANGRASTGRQLTDVLLRIQGERDPETGRHVGDVECLARQVGAALGMADGDLQTLSRAASLHDIGKVAIPDSILRKPGPLSPAEWEFMRRHTVIGERMLAEAPALAPVAALVRSSHEAWDGSGYPDALAGDAIPLGARIIAVCDAYEAIVSDRPYRRAASHERALAELRRCAGRQFDPRVVEAFAAAVAAPRRLEPVA